MRFKTSRAALIGLGAATLVFSASPAAANDLMEHRKSLSAAVDSFLQAMPRMAPGSQGKTLNLTAEMRLLRAEMEHLRDLEDLLAVTHEPTAKKLLTERLSWRRTSIDMACRFLETNLPTFAKISQDPVLIGEIMAAQKVIDPVCARVRSR